MVYSWCGKELVKHSLQQQTPQLQQQQLGLSFKLWPVCFWTNSCNSTAATATIGILSTLFWANRDNSNSSTIAAATATAPAETIENLVK
jgi:hypothetical protein